MTTNHHPAPIINARHVWREFAGKYVLRDVTLGVPAGSIHALLGPNGAGKTTLLRILTGLIEPSLGRVEIAGEVPRPAKAGGVSPIGLVPSSDRSFYLRISGLENLAFFARLHGMSRRDALRRSWEMLEHVGLHDVGRQRAFEYSHGMLKRLGVARALLTEPAALLVDEATHDLDPEGAQRIRDLIQGLALTGTAVIWTTQRIEEIRGLADCVTVLARGEVRFEGTVVELAARASTPGYVLTLNNGGSSGPHLLEAVRGALRNRATVSPAPGEVGGRFRLRLGPGVILGEVFSALSSSNLTITACREERPEIEDAFLSVTKETES